MREVWVPLDGGVVGGDVNSLAWDGANLYVCGSFTTAGGSSASRVAMWDGSNWSSLGSGVGHTALCSVWSDGYLYVGGFFGISRWDGLSWSSLAGYPGGVVWAMTLGSGSDIYVARVDSVMVWNGSSFSYLPGTFDTGAIRRLLWDGTYLYVGGDFTAVDATTVNHIARWDGAEWSGLDSGVEAGPVITTVTGMAVDSASLYVSGSFTLAGGNTAHNIAMWSDGSWSAFSPEPPPPQLAGPIMYDGSYLYTASTRTYKWDWSTWTQVGTAMNAGAAELGLFGGDIYSGGYATTADNAPTTTINGIAKLGYAYTISGTITDGVVGLEGVSVNVTGYDTIQTDADGLYAIEVIPGVEYTIAPVVPACYAAVPEDRVISVDVADVSGLDFVFNPSPPIVSGDALICAGELSTLEAQIGFDSYLWSPGGETERVIYVGAGEYSVTTTGMCPGTSATFTVTEFQLPSPTISGESHFVCPGEYEGTTINLSAGVDGYSGELTFEWFKDGVLQPSLPNVSAGVGAWTVRATNQDGCTSTSEQFIIAELQPIVSYEWYKNGEFYSTGLTVEADDGIWTVKAIDAGGCFGISAPAEVEVGIAPEVTVQSVKLADGTVRLEITSFDLDSTYQWYLDGDIMPGETGRSIIAPQPGVYTVTGQTLCGESTSMSEIVLGVPQPCDIIVTHPSDLSNISPIGYMSFDIYADGIDLPTIDYINLTVYSDAGSPGHFNLIPELSIGSSYVSAEAKQVFGHWGWTVRIDNYQFTPCSVFRIEADVMIP